VAARLAPLPAFVNAKQTQRNTRSAATCTYARRVLRGKAMSIRPRGRIGINCARVLHRISMRVLSPRSSLSGPGCHRIRRCAGSVSTAAICETRLSTGRRHRFTVSRDKQGSICTAAVVVRRLGKLAPRARCGPLREILRVCECWARADALDHTACIVVGADAGSSAIVCAIGNRHPRSLIHTAAWR